MPLVTLTIRRSVGAMTKNAILDAVHESLVSVGVPLADRFQRIIAVEDDELRVDPIYPDLSRPRTKDFAMVEILWSVGRSVKVKRQWFEHFVAKLAASEIDPENVLVVFKETQWENWSFGGGRLLHA